MAKKFIRKFNKPVPVSYVKSFDSFEDGFKEAVTFNPELTNYLGSTGEYNAVIQHILKVISASVPSVNNPNYPNTVSLSIDSNEVGFKTDANVAIGWRTGFNYKTGIQYFNFRLSYIGVPAYKMGVFSDLESNGWEKIDPENTKQSRFWNKVEDKRKNNRSSHNATANEAPAAKEVEAAVPIKEEPKEEEKPVEVNEVTPEKDPVVVEEDSTIDPPKQSFPATKEEAMQIAIDNGFLNDLTSNSFEWYNETTDTYVDISKEEVYNYANRNINSINRCAVDNKFSVTYHGKSYIIDTKTTDSNPEFVIVNPANSTITIEEVTYDYVSLKVYKN